MINQVNLSKVKPTSQMKGEDEQETAELQQLFEEALEYLKSLCL